MCIQSQCLYLAGGDTVVWCRLADMDTALRHDLRFSLNEVLYRSSAPPFQRHLCMRRTACVVIRELILSPLSAREEHWAAYQHKIRLGAMLAVTESIAIGHHNNFFAIGQSIHSKESLNELPTRWKQQMAFTVGIRVPVFIPPYMHNTLTL